MEFIECVTQILAAIIINQSSMADREEQIKEAITIARAMGIAIHNEENNGE